MDKTSREVLTEPAFNFRLHFLQCDRLIHGGPLSCQAPLHECKQTSKRRATVLAYYYFFFLREMEKEKVIGG